LRTRITSLYITSMLFNLSMKAPFLPHFLGGGRMVKLALAVLSVSIPVAMTS
jgi:hypothetical protein